MLDGLETISPSTLTTGVDTFSGANMSVVGSYGITDGGVESGTLTPGDSVTATGGTNQLSLTVSGTGTAANPFGPTTFSGVQTFSVRDVSTGAGAGVYDFAATTGETAVKSNLSTNDVSFTGVASGSTVGIVGNGAVINGAVSATYVAGTTAALISVAGDVVGGNGITITNATGITSATITTSGAVTADGADVGAVQLADGNTVTSATINAASDVVINGISGFSTTSASTLTVNGAGAVNVGLLAATLDTINASGNTGGLTATLNSATAAVTGGAGNDTIETGVVLTTGTVDGGTGTTDTLVVTLDGAVNTTTLGAKYSNFEILGVATGVSVSTTNLAANNAFTGAYYADGGTITNMNAAMAANVQAAASGDYVFGIKDATNPSTNNTLVITASDDDAISPASTVTFGTFTAAGVENITLNATDKIVVSTLIGAADLEALTLNGAQTQTITSGALALNPSFTVAATAATGVLTLDFSDATTRGGVFNLGSAADKVAAVSGFTDSINGGAGADTIIGDSNVEVQTITCTTTSVDNTATVVVGGVTLAGIVQSNTEATSATNIANAIIGNATLIAAGITAVADGAEVTISSIALNGNIAQATYTSSGAGDDVSVDTTDQGGANTKGDIITGGAGNDVFFLSYGADNSVANADTIVDFDFGTSTTAADVLKVSGTGTTAIYTLTAVQQTAVTNAASIAAATALVLADNAANGAVTSFTYGVNTYLAINGDGNGTYDADADFLVKITGSTGTLSATDVVFVS